MAPKHFSLEPFYKCSCKWEKAWKSFFHKQNNIPNTIVLTQILNGFSEECAKKGSLSYHCQHLNSHEIHHFNELCHIIYFLLYYVEDNNADVMQYHQYINDEYFAHIFGIVHFCNNSLVSYKQRASINTTTATTTTKNHFLTFWQPNQKFPKPPIFYWGKLIFCELCAHFLVHTYTNLNVFTFYTVNCMTFLWISKW